MNYILQILSDIKSNYFGRKKISTILKKLLGRARFEALSLSSADERQWLDAGSVLYGKGAEVFLDAVASEYGMTALHVIPKTSQIDTGNVEKFLQAGCCLLRKDNILLGVVTCAPEKTAKALPEFNGIPRYLSSWKLIQEALEGAPIKDHNYHPLEKIFDIAQTYNAVKLNICSAKFVYHLETQDGKRASGNISPETVTEIVQEVSRRTESSGTFNYQTCEYIVEKLGSVTHFTLKQKLILPSTQKIVPLSLAATNGDERKSTPSDEGEKRYVLLVDDNQSFTKVVSKYLKSLTIESVVLNNGQEALDYLGSHDAPSVVVCDLHMPQKNGFDVVHFIRNSQSLSSVPIIMLTSDQDIEAEIAFIELGVDAFIKKNQDPRLLTTQIKRLLNPLKSSLKAA